MRALLALLLLGCGAPPPPGPLDLAAEASVPADLLPPDSRFEVDQGADDLATIDLATETDLAAPADLATEIDLPTLADLATAADRTVASDLTATPDLATAPDLAMPPDLARPGVPDLASRPDLASGPDLAPPALVDPTTLKGKLVFGYQGWFGAPGDGSIWNSWVHWFRNGKPDAANVTVDMWPELSEAGPNELFPTQLTMPDGKPAMLYSASVPATVRRHFAWMEQHGLDGVMLQRFSKDLGDPRVFDFRNRVTDNVRAGAEGHGRVFAIMYDISGHDPTKLLADLQKDWTYLVDVKRVTDSPRYLRHRGRPLVAIWGFGFAGRADTPAQAAAVIAWFKSQAPAKYRATLMGGVPAHWRLLANDSQADPAWGPVYRSFDVLSPWSVGRYADDAGADNFRKNLIAGDLAEAGKAGIDYLPVVWPGFSWRNLMKGATPTNQIPRRGGRFWWRQTYNALAAGSTMVYGAMFDEVDEGTAMFKVAATAARQPVQPPFVPLDADGEKLPTDWYLRLAGAGTRMLRGEIPLGAQIPIQP